MTGETWKLIKSAIDYINKGKIPRDPQKVKEMLRRLEKEEYEFQEMRKNIKKIKDLQQARKDRKTQPDTRSIFNRCRKCHDLYRKSEEHSC